MVRSPASPEFNTDCTEVRKLKWSDKTVRLDGSPAKPGWKYNLAHMPRNEQSKKILWFAETSLRKIPGPKQSAEDFLKQNFPTFNKEHA